MSRRETGIHVQSEKHVSDESIPQLVVGTITSGEFKVQRATGTLTVPPSTFDACSEPGVLGPRPSGPAEYLMNPYLVSQ